MKAIQRLSAFLSSWLGEEVTPRQTLGALSAAIGTALVLTTWHPVFIILAITLLGFGSITLSQKGGAL